MFDKALRIGTRDSQLARLQAHVVVDLLEASYLKTQLVAIKSAGDLNLTQPIYAMGIQGVFTKALDIALLENRIDLAVHSLKDVPTQLPEGLTLGAVLERGSACDVLVQTRKTDLQQTSTVATGSLRRKAQWLHRYPHHHVVNLRGNIQVRMDKLFSSKWEGAIFAKAGLERLELVGSYFQELKWMIPAPAQGAIGIVCRADENELIKQLQKINHQPTRQCTDIERDFLRILEGGCSAPIGAYAFIARDKIQFKGGVFSLDGQIAAITSKEVQMDVGKNLAAQAAEEVLSKGGHQIVRTIKYSKE
ncbi:MAG: hydroxymethylbilane synthase [Bacteroidota bacterium]|nr:hydroxymethylbilane synthase [Bacteroidota bacterium]